MYAHGRHLSFSFDEHTRAIRGQDKEEIAKAYHEVSKNGGLLPPGGPGKSPSDDELASIEQSLRTPAHTIYE